MKTSRTLFSVENFLNFIVIFILVGSQFGWAVGTALAEPGDIVVNSTSDLISDDGNCTLREAIQAANTDASVDACLPGSGADIIKLPAGTYTLSLSGPGENANLTGDLDILGDLEIIGADANSTIIIGGTGWGDRILDIDPADIGITVTLSNINVQNGNLGPWEGSINSKPRASLNVIDSIVKNNSGIGIMSWGGNLAISGSHISNNTGTGIFSLNQFYPGKVTVINSLIDNNHGGIWSVLPLEVVGSDFIGNSDSGIWVMGSLTLTDVNIMNNATSYSGGGLSALNISSSVLKNVTISGNSAQKTGGGIIFWGLGWGGTQLTLENVTISGNTADISGGGIQADSGDWSYLDINNVTLTGNQSPLGSGIFNKSNTTIKNTIVSDNTGGPNCGGALALVSDGYNIDSGSSCGFSNAGDLSNANPLIGPLANNGGFGFTHALLSGSPAIDAGDNVDCPATDQRGITRPSGLACDIGAYELFLDSDEDGIQDNFDNAPNIFNPDQSDIDEDGVGDVADPCPADATNTCNQDGSAATAIGPDGGTLSTANGNVTIIAPVDALPEYTSISITDNGSGFMVNTDMGEINAVVAAEIGPSGTNFETPITLLFEWQDEDINGIVDGTTIDENNLFLSKDGVVIAGPCATDSACNMSTNTITIEVSSLSVFVIGGVPNRSPEVQSITAPGEPQQVFTSISVSANFLDPDINDNHTAIWDWGDDTTSSGTIVEGNGSVTGDHIYSTPGVYTIKVTITDKFGVSGENYFQYVVIYDPEGGFVTGGGWIWSPEGAYTPNPSLTGKATFGFVSKYEKGTNVPIGNTEFQFRVADLNFKSFSYDWLVIAGNKAKYKGTGTINGEGEYAFMISAIDGSPDLFRIKIWDKATDEVIYDNQLGASDNDDPVTLIQGGSIVVHKEK